MCGHFALLEAYSKHSDDCYWVWVLNDTPFRLIRGDEANCLLGSKNDRYPLGLEH